MKHGQPLLILTGYIKGKRDRRKQQVTSSCKWLAEEEVEKLAKRQEAVESHDHLCPERILCIEEDC